MTERRLRFVIFLDAPGRWVVRGLEHDLAAEAHTIGEAVRSVTRLVLAHAEFDVRHHLDPLSAFPAAPQSCWNAYASGTPIPLDQLGVVAPEGWDIHASFATRVPCEHQPRLARPVYVDRSRPVALRA